MPDASLLPLSGKHALVTGGGTGIGATSALALAAAGARVTVAGRREGPLREVAQRLGAASAGVVMMDVTDEASVAVGVKAAEAAGPIDILVNNAGAADSAPFQKTTLAALNRMMAVNLNGVFLVTQAVLPGMLARKSGRIINIASTAGLVGYAYVSAYVAAKHAVIGLTRSLALEVARRGVTVNSVCPGFTETDLVAESVANIVAKTGRSEAEAKAELAKTNPMGRLVSPDEVADAVVWLAGPRASSINGQAIAVAGGEVMTG
jgi:NAD(P)-dependent dehydrogenase (short-subunit alcohol dehydrogenase family)